MDANMEHCKQVFQPVLDRVCAAIDANDWDAAAGEINRVADDRVRDFALFVAIHVDSCDRLLRAVLTENKSAGWSA